MEPGFFLKQPYPPAHLQDALNKIGSKAPDEPFELLWKNGRHISSLVDEEESEDIIRGLRNCDKQKIGQIEKDVAVVYNEQSDYYLMEFKERISAGGSRKNDHIDKLASSNYRVAMDEDELELDGEGLTSETLDYVNLSLDNLLDVDNFVHIVQRCAQKGNLELAKRLHAHICGRGMESYVLVANHMIRMFVECGSTPIAEQILVRLELRIEQSWTFLISGYVQCGRFSDAFKLHQKMLEDYVQPSSYTFVALLKACAGLGNLEEGRAIHNEIRQNKVSTELHVGNTLVGMYANFGYLTEARDVFDNLIAKSVVSWTALIAGYAEHGPAEEALVFLMKMQQNGVAPNDVTFACALKACGSLGSIIKGREIHGGVVAQGFAELPLVGNSLIDMYGKCDSCEEAQEVFDKLAARDVVSWTALIGGYVESGYGQHALKCFDHMQSQGVPGNALTFSCALKACSSEGDVDKGREIYSKAVQEGLEDDIAVGNTLIGLYAKCGFLVEAQEVFDSMLVKDVVSWTALTAGYAEHGRGQVGVEIFEQMQLEGVSANRVALACALKACGSIGAIHKGHTIHREVIKKGLENDSVIAHTLISMYARCCCLSEARDVFDKLPCFDVVAWSTMIKGYGLNHKGDMAVQCFESMKNQGIKPNAVTFTCLLMACSHASLVDNGHKFFKLMREDCGISPLAEHYACMVDLLSRSGHLFEAERFLESMCPPSKESWAALLTACKTVGEVELGFRCFQELVKLDEKDGTWFVIMADIYSNVGMWDDVYKIEELRKSVGAYKKPAVAVIEVDQKLHEFVAGQNESKEVLLMLESLNLRAKQEGHSASGSQDSRSMLDKEEDSFAHKHKNSLPCEHAERVAIAFGILYLPGGETLRVTKNLRMCNDCHTTSKILSKTEKREIILQDSCCIHHFKDGLCSCGDMF